MANNKKKNKGGAKKQGGDKGFPVTGVVITVLVILLGIGAGLGIWLLSQGESDAIELVEADLPSYVDRADAPPGAEKAYRVALTIPDDLAQIPCYCSCGDSAGHESNLDCFIKSQSGDNVVFDDHAAYWGLWIDIALDVFQWKEDGKSIQDIRKEVEDKYGSDFGDPTPTPPVE